jgi:hypothetical protein
LLLITGWIEGWFAGIDLSFRRFESVTEKVLLIPHRRCAAQVSPPNCVR